jgi:hypothetical protein
MKWRIFRGEPREHTRAVIGASFLEMAKWRKYATSKMLNKKLFPRLANPAETIDFPDTQPRNCF